MNKRYDVFLYRFTSSYEPKNKMKSYFFKCPAQYDLEKSSWHCKAGPRNPEAILDVVLNLDYAWRIPGTEEPSGLPSMGSHRVGHD